MYKNQFLFDVNCPELNVSLSQLGSMLPSDEPFIKPNGEYNSHLLLRYFGYLWSIAKEHNLIENNDNLHVFNTGLVTKLWNPIYCVISKTRDGKHSQPYTLIGYFADGEGNFKILANFTKLPPRPTLYTSVSQLHYNPSDNGISVDYVHLMNRLSRAKLPEEFLARIQSPDCTLRPADGKAYYEELRDHLKRDPISEMILRSTLERAVKLSIKRATIDPFCAAPCFNPRLKEVTLLLPLSMSGNPERVDCCLVVSKQNEQQYVGVTILSLEEAYANARLMGRFSSSWLSNRN